MMVRGTWDRGWVMGIAGALLLVMMTAAPVSAGDISSLSKGQTVYVPGYSHIYTGDKERPVLLAVTVSIRNTDPNHWIQIDAVDYYDTEGNLIKKYLNLPAQLRAMASTRFVIPESDKGGGSGANFIVRWSAQNPVNPPVIETVMISTRMQLGISFTSRGQVLQEAK